VESPRCSASRLEELGEPLTTAAGFALPSAGDFADSVETAVVEEHPARARTKAIAQKATLVWLSIT
jgi:hypothetical protein